MRQEQQLGAQRITSSPSRAVGGGGPGHTVSLCLETEQRLLPGASVGRNWALFIIHCQAGCIQISTGAMSKPMVRLLDTLISIPATHLASSWEPEGTYNYFLAKCLFA